MPPPQPQAGMPPTSFITDEISQIYDKIIREIEVNHLPTLALGPPNNPQLVQTHGLLEAVRLAANSRQEAAAQNLLTKVLCVLLD